jgi:SAM-dependent methyltransferase
MKVGKYFDWDRGVPLTEEDGCIYEDWREARGKAHFARLGDRIYVFLDQEEIDLHDKYRSGVFDLELDVDSAFHRMRIENTLLLLEHFKRSGGKLSRLLDVGCGMGHFLEAVRKRFPDLEATGLEISLTALQRAAERIPGSESVLADAHNPPFSPGYFDAILLNNVLEHGRGPFYMLKGLGRVLSPGGCLVLSTPSRYRFDNLIRVVLGKPVGLMSVDHITEYTVGQVTELLANCGYEVLQVLGPKRKPTRWTVRNAVSHCLLKPALRAWLRVVGSNHVIESTAFFMARKRTKNA